MKPSIKIGLLAGVIGLVLNVCVSATIGICGPAVSLVAGAVAGYFAARQERPAIKGDGAKAGATAGGIAGLLIIIGQIIGAVGALAYMQYSGATLPFGTIPSQSADAATQAIFYISGAGTSLCFGLVGTFLAALAGAGTGYAATPDQTPPTVMNP